VYVRYLGQGNHQIYGRMRCKIYTILANPTVVASTQLCRGIEQLQGRAGSFKDTFEKEEDTHTHTLLGMW